MSAAITAAVIAAGGAAYAANKQSKAADKARKAASGPWSETSERQPWGEAMPYLSGALGENWRVYQQALNSYQNASRMGRGRGRREEKNITPGRKGKGGGGGGGAGNQLLKRMTDRAMNRSPLLDKASGYVSSSLGATDGWTEGEGGPGGPFGGNPVYNELYRRLTADAGGAGGEGGAGGGTDSNGDGIPDSMSGSTFFNDEMRKFFDPTALDPANDPTMAPYVAALRREMEEDRDAELATIDDRANAIGMYGGSGRALEAARTREEADEALASQLAQVYMGSRESALARQMQGLGMISDRDLALMDSNESGRLNDLDRLFALGGALTGERQWGTEAAMGLHDQEMGDLGNVFGIYEQRRRAAAAAAEREQERQMSQRRWRAQQARQDALMPMNIFGDYLKGLGVLTDLGPATTTASGQGQRGGGQYYDSGPGAAAAGLSSLGGSMMALYGMGAFGNGGRGGAAAAPSYSGAGKGRGFQGKG